MYLCTQREIKQGGYSDLIQKKILLGKNQFYTFLSSFIYLFSLAFSLSLSLFSWHHFTACGLLIRFCLIYMTLSYFLVSHRDGKCVHAWWQPLCLPLAFSSSL